MTKWPPQSTTPCSSGPISVSWIFFRSEGSIPAMRSRVGSVGPRRIRGFDDEMAPAVHHALLLRPDQRLVDLLPRLRPDDLHVPGGRHLADGIQEPERPEFRDEDFPALHAVEAGQDEGNGLLGGRGEAGHAGIGADHLAAPIVPAAGP